MLFFSNSNFRPTDFSLSYLIEVNQMIFAPVRLSLPNCDFIQFSRQKQFIPIFKLLDLKSLHCNLMKI